MFILCEFIIEENTESCREFKLMMNSVSHILEKSLNAPFVSQNIGDELREAVNPSRNNGKNLHCLSITSIPPNYLCSRTNEEVISVHTQKTVHPRYFTQYLRANNVKIGCYTIYFSFSFLASRESSSLDKNQCS